MESTLTGWRALARRQWPVALAVATLVVIEHTYAYDPQWWSLPGAVLLGGLAVVAPRQPFDAALVGAVTIVGSSLLLRVAHIELPVTFLGVLTPSESLATMALIAYVVRQTSRPRALLSGAALVAASLLTYLLRERQRYDFGTLDGPQQPLYEPLLSDLLLLAVAVGTGLYFRARDGDRRRVVTTAVMGARQAERIALARELHDVVAHHVTGMVVHAQAARLVAEQDPATAARSLDLIAHSGTEALAAMRRLVSTLRQAERTTGASGAAAAGEATTDLAADLRRVVEQASAVGAPVHLLVRLPERVRPELARSVLRLVQESLTNTRKHAHDVTAIRVEVTHHAGVLRVAVADDGQPTRHDREEPVGGSGGFGLVGMRERVQLLDGSFYAGPGPDGGWLVSAELPLREGES
ncbi:sensor histidine kinase [Longimycelium tulufanense]|uniref:sensor histidine kinase n=1 Tax=Longimycelium tulufanense TaxID=907463 RepID=UPI00166E8A40|nr:histidine kinase [Longimycelium tulufanense]